MCYVCVRLCVWSKCIYDHQKEMRPRLYMSINNKCSQSLQFVVHVDESFGAKKRGGVRVGDIYSRATNMIVSAYFRSVDIVLNFDKEASSDVFQFPLGSRRLTRYTLS